MSTLLKAPPLLYGYAAFLVLMGVIAFVLSDFTATTALAAPAVMAVLVAVMGWLASTIERNHLAGMIGIHVGLILPVLYAAMFGYLAFARLTGEEPVIYLGTIFIILCLGSIAAFGLLMLARPRPADRK